jgi:hypothetical protein
MVLTKPGKMGGGWGDTSGSIRSSRLSSQRTTIDERSRR